MPSKPTVAAKGCVTYKATISAPISRASDTPLFAAWAESGEPSAGIRIFLNIWLTVLLIIHHGMQHYNPSLTRFRHKILAQTANRLHHIKATGWPDKAVNTVPPTCNTQELAWEVVLKAHQRLQPHAGPPRQGQLAEMPLAGQRRALPATSPPLLAGPAPPPRQAG